MAKAKTTDFDLDGGVGVQATADAGSMTFNLSDVEEPSFELMPQGQYEAIVEEFNFTESKAGAPMLAAVYTVIAGEFEGRKLYDYFVLDGAGAQFALPKLKQLLLATVPDVDLSAFNPGEFAESGEIINTQCVIDVAIQTQKKGEYKGEKRNTVRRVLPANLSSGSFLG